MAKSITVTDYFGGCPTCGRNDGLYNVGKQRWFACHTHKVRWTTGPTILSSSRVETEYEQQESWDRLRDETEDEQRERWAVVADYEDIKDRLVLEGTWSLDPEVRRQEYDAERQKLRDEEVRRQRRAERLERVAAILVDALTPVAADMPPGEEISVRVHPNTNLILSAAGVQQEDHDDFPF